MKNLAQRAREVEATNNFGVDMAQIEIDRYKREEDNLKLLSAYNQKVNMIDVLVAEIEGLKSNINNIDAKTENVHRSIFKHQVEEVPVKRLTPKQQRAKVLKDEIEAERLETLMLISQM